jgi:hypothetical protein
VDHQRVEQQDAAGPRRVQLRGQLRRRVGPQLDGLPPAQAVEHARREPTAAGAIDLRDGRALHGRHAERVPAVVVEDRGAGRDTVEQGADAGQHPGLAVHQGGRGDQVGAGLP